MPCWATRLQYICTCTGTTVRGRSLELSYHEPRSTGSPGPSRGPSGAWAIYFYL
eukprot:SAG11_NODE_670_length_7823_cov_9.340886_2_plen_54_part_00